jgi:hypothetical protein
MERLVPSPIFILTLPRSGSTLLRCILDTHSRVCAPHELHLTMFGLRPLDMPSRLSLEVAGLTPGEAEHLLWDRILHWHLVRSGKERLVEKTPNNLANWRRLAECWPDAQYVFLLRHPASVLASVFTSIPVPSDQVEWRQRKEQHMLEMCAALDEARGELDGHTLRYEELTSDPATAVRAVCDHIGVPFEPDMLHYGRVDHGPFLKGVGDFADLIRTGRIQPRHHGPPVGPTSTTLREVCHAWGYPA